MACSERQRETWGEPTIVEVCSHRVSVWYDFRYELENVTLDDDMRRDLLEWAEERAAEMIPEGWVCGQLCFTVETDDGESDADIYGSWAITTE